MYIWHADPSVDPIVTSRVETYFEESMGQWWNPKSDHMSTGDKKMDEHRAIFQHVASLVLTFLFEHFNFCFPQSFLHFRGFERLLLYVTSALAEATLDETLAIEAVDIMTMVNNAVGTEVRQDNNEVSASCKIWCHSQRNTSYDTPDDPSAGCSRR